MRTLYGFFFLALCSLTARAAEAPKTAAEPAPAQAAAAQTNPQVTFKTNLGEVRIELFPQAAPVTVQNFLQYVDSGFYQGVIFHRVVPGFVVQAGGYDATFQRRAPRAPIVNESANGLKNLRGTLSMARSSPPDSGTSQFFINLKDNPPLDWSFGQPGYAVFGRVVEGMAVVDAMAEQPQGNHSGEFSNAPNTPVVIESVYRSGAAASGATAPGAAASSATAPGATAPGATAPGATASGAAASTDTTSTKAPGKR